VQVNIKNLIDEFGIIRVRELRWPDGVTCPSCQCTSHQRGLMTRNPHGHAMRCTDCHTRFDDLTDTIFAGHHQPLKVWILRLYSWDESVQISCRVRPGSNMSC